MNMEKLDKIIVSKEDVELLFQWRDTHKEFVRNYKSVLIQGAIELDKHHRQVFNDDGKNIIHQIYLSTPESNFELYHTLSVNKETNAGYVAYTKFEDDFDIDGYNHSIVSLHASLMAYMEYYGDKKEYVNVSNATINKVKKTGKKNNYKKKNVVKIRKKIYSVSIDKQAVIRDKRRYERHMDKWTVRGHWRTTKLGKRVWIAPYPKGEGKEVTAKEYKM